MWEALMGLLFSPPDGARPQLHLFLALAAGLISGVAAAKLGHGDSAPYAAIAGFFIYILLAALFAIAKFRR